MSQKIAVFLGVLVLWSTLSPTPALGQALGISYYFDSRNFNTLAVSVSAKDLWKGVSVWGFTDLHSQHEMQPHRYDLTRSFSEYRLSRTLVHSPSLGNLGIQFEYNDFTPGINAVGRFGMTLKRALPNLEGSWLRLRLFPVETISGRAHFSLFCFVRILNWMHVAGFADCNLREHEKTHWVIEPQLTVFVAQRFCLLVEYRYNGFESDAPGISGSGVAFGLGARF